MARTDRLGVDAASHVSGAWLSNATPLSKRYASTYTLQTGVTGAGASTGERYTG